MGKQGWLTAAGAAACLLLAAACDDPFVPDPEANYKGPVVPDVGGDWKGYWFMRDNDGSRHGTIEITARILLNETDHTKVTLITSKDGRGHLFTGTIDATGWMELYDHDDGQEWTTHYRRATPGLVEIDDFLMDDGKIEGLNTVLLNEHLEKGRGHGDGEDEDDSDSFTLF